MSLYRFCICDVLRFINSLFLLSCYGNSAICNWNTQSYVSKTNGISCKGGTYFAVNYSAAELNDLLSAAEGVPEDEKYKTLETAIFLDLIKPRLKGAIKLQKSEKLFENLA